LQGIVTEGSIEKVKNKLQAAGTVG
jgi:hypothetical protein